MGWTGWTAGLLLFPLLEFLTVMTTMTTTTTTSSLKMSSKHPTIGILVEQNLSWMVMSGQKYSGMCNTDTWQLGAVTVMQDTFQASDLAGLRTSVDKMRSKDVRGVVVLANCDNQQLLNHLLTQRRVPHIQVPPTYCYRDSFMEGRSPWRLRQRATSLGQVVKDVIRALNRFLIKEIIIFTDGTYNINQASVILHSLSADNIRFMAYQVNYTTASYRDILQLRKKSIKRTYFLLLTYGQGSMEILHYAKEMDLIRYNTFWLLGNLDMNIEDLKRLDLQDIRSNILYIKKPCINSMAGVPVQRKGFNISITDNYVLQKVAHYFTQCLNMSDTTPEPLQMWHAELFFPSASLDENTDMIMLDPVEVVDRKYDIFRVDGYEGDISYKRVGEWCTDEGLVFSMTPKSMRDIFPNALTGLGNRTLKVGTLLVEPYVRRINGSWEGFCIDILLEMSRTLNFNYQLMEVPDKMFGSFNNVTLNWTGIVGMAYNNEIDLGIAPITLTAERFEYIDFTQPFAEDGIGIVYRIQNDHVPMDMIFRPFEMDVWLLIPVAIFVVGIFLTFINKVSSLCSSTENPQQINLSYVENCWYTFGTALSQGPNNEPKNIPGRVIIIFWWLFVILVTTYYTASLAAILTIKVSKLSITSLEDLANHPTIRPITLAGATWSTYFLKSQKPSYRKIGEELLKSPKRTDSAEVMQLVINGDFAYVMDSSVVRYYAAKDKKNLAFVEEKGYRQSLGFITPKHSPIRELVSFNIIKYQELGLMEKWRRKWCNCTKQLLLRKSVETNPLTLEDLGGAFLVLAGTAVLGLILALIERLVKRFRPGKVDHTTTGTTTGTTHSEDHNRDNNRHHAQ